MRCIFAMHTSYPRVLSSHHVPRRLLRFFPSPAAAVKLFMDPVTVRKVNMVRSKDMPAIADALCGADRATADWLLAAIAIENKPGTALPPLPPAAPTQVHTLIARGSTLEEVIAREASTRVGVPTPALPASTALGGGGASAGGAAGGAGAAVAAGLA